MRFMDWGDFAFWLFVVVWVIVLIGMIKEQRRRYRIVDND